MLVSKQVFTPNIEEGAMTAQTTAPNVDSAARLRAVIGGIHRRLRKTPSAAAAGLTPTRISVLLSVARSGPVKLSELANKEGLNPTLLSRVVGDLADSGLLERATDEGDRRAAWVKATSTGKRVAERMRRERTDALYVALAALPESDRVLVERALPSLELLAEQLRERRE
jgi:DNA-binding MarR family transcriptional regulator